jgi:ferric-dicitrate binding protein FerR (iron transport regulator)
VNLPYRSPHDAARALGRLLRDDTSESSSDGSDIDAQRELLLRTVRVLGSPRPRKTHTLAWALATAAALCVVGFGWHRLASNALTFAVGGSARAFGSTLAAEAAREEPVQFSDGSTFALEPGAHLRVESATATGSRLSLIDGKTVAHVVHRPKSSWALTAGPFEVQVTGTRFCASWDPTLQRLSVELYDGSVQVVGGSLRGPIAVHTGQRFEAGPGDGNWLLTALSAPTGTALRITR